jgi:hypothetical protein
MKLSEATVEILKNFATINGSLQFRKGSVLTTITTGKTILATARVAESFPFDFAIYDLNKLLAKLSQYKDGELDLQTDRVVFKSADNRRTDYIKYSSPKVMILPDPNKKISLDNPEHEFLLSSEDLTWQRKSAGISASPYLIFRGDGKKVLLQTTDLKDDSSDLSSTEIGKTTETFVYAIKIENLKMIDGSYRVKLAKGLSKFEHTEKSVEYYVAVETALSEV